MKLKCTERCGGRPSLYITYTISKKSGKKHYRWSVQCQRCGHRSEPRARKNPAARQWAVECVARQLAQ
jgi:hypothetical protein